jgi:cytochrome c551
VRRLLTVLVALLLPLLAAACGGGTTEDTAPQDIDTQAPTETGAATDTDAAETTETAAEDDEGAQGDPEAGAEIFASQGCGNCHVYEPAGTSGTVGPSLDESDVDFEGAVQQIRTGGGGMPAYEGQLSDEEIANVAAFVTEDSR